jgi:Holliday junction resolvase RusA-like endonuclease
LDPFLINLTFPQRPVPWSRTVRGDRTKRRLKQDKYIKDLATMLKAEAGGETIEGPAFVRCEFDYENKCTLIQVMEVERYNLKTTRADLDNLLKMVLEALQKSGIVKDDAQVAIVEAEKIE